MVSQQLLIKLKKIIKEEYERDLGMKEISQIGNGLVDYFDLLAEINHKNKPKYENEISTTKIQ